MMFFLKCIIHVSKAKYSRLCQYIKKQAITRVEKLKSKPNFINSRYHSEVCNQWRRFHASAAGTSDEIDFSASMGAGTK